MKKKILFVHDVVKSVACIKKQNIKYENNKASHCRLKISVEASIYISNSVLYLCDISTSTLVTQHYHYRLLQPWG